MSAPIQELKTALRAEVRSKLRQLSPDERTVASARICARLEQQEVWQQARAILFYAPLPDEPDVWPLVADGLSAGKTIALPRFVPDQNRFVARVIREPAKEVQPGQFGVREPADPCPEIPLNRLDLILVPGVGFDLNGRRLGRGKGFYDRWLANHHGTTCGVAFDQQIIGTIPVEPHDIRLSCILTPTRWQKVGSRRAVLE
ncbi:MAG: 5-formyltetrahydrofolate cyclo-ligase [Verrucomicrobia bacterium]|nr:5-formyltetrahydrofolate cyclo-ligase [Verrucomicrobiota bacterium]